MSNKRLFISRRPFFVENTPHFFLLFYLKKLQAINYYVSVSNNNPC
jgi:hypothetical protein